MKLIANALQSIADSINRLARAVENKSLVNVVQPTSQTITSNPGYSATKVSIDYPNKSKINLPSDLQVIADQIYRALTDKGIDPNHHDKMYRDLAIKWPVLYKALRRLEIHIDQSKGSYKTYPEYSSKKYNIWNFEK